MLSVKHPHIGLSVDALQAGLAVQMKNVTSVRKFQSINYHFKISISFFNLIKILKLSLDIWTFVDECITDDDCPYDKQCKDKECKDPCLSILCGSRAECKAEYHKAVCFCPRGMQGNPLISCVEVGCTSNSDCSLNEKCDYVPSSNKKDCLPLCTRNPCAAGASCTAQNHRETCTCDYPLQGDGYISCTECKYIKKCSWILELYAV